MIQLDQTGKYDKKPLLLSKVPIHRQSRFGRISVRNQLGYWPTQLDRIKNDNLAKSQNTPFHEAGKDFSSPAI